jgi:hypothetical protein
MTDEALSLRTWLGKILLVLTGVIFALGLCEVGLRLAGIEYPHFYTFDPATSAKLRPGIKGYWLKEGGGYVSINSDGWRDREHAVKKPPNTLRIAVLGDSFVEAMQVNEDETFSAILEKELQRCGNLQGRKVEVLNFGISGFGTTQELLTLHHRVWKYSPDIVLLAFTSGNDVAENSPALNLKVDVPFYVFKDGQLGLDDSRTKRAAQVWSTYEKNLNWLGRFYIWRHDTFRILQVIDYAKSNLRDWWAQRSGDMTGTVKQGVAGAGMFVDIYHEPTDEVWKEAWKITEAVMLKMRDEVAERGAQLDVVVLSNDIQVHPDPKVQNQVATYPGVEDIFYPDHRVERFCHNKGIPVLLLGPPFREYAIKHQVFLHGFRTLFRNTLGWGHWNRQGHRLAGETIAKWLCPQIK